jgi:fibronectin type 3 domain-containing protein
MATRTTSASQFPSWSRAPLLDFVTGTADVVALADSVKYPFKGRLVYTVISGSLPSGVTRGPSPRFQLITWSGSGSVGDTVVRFRCTDPQTGNFADSPSATIRIKAPAPLLPMAPVLESVVADSASEITVTWTRGVGGSDPVSYKVFRSLTGVAPWTDISHPSASPYQDTGLQADTEYFYCVSAVDANQAESSQSVAKSARTPITLPAMPVNVVATAQNGTTIRVTWTDGTDGSPPTSYQAITSPSGVAGSYTAPATVTMPYDDTTLSPGETRYYRVRGVNSAGVSAGSPAVFAKTPVPVAPSTPTNIGVVPSGGTGLEVSWTPGLGGSTPTTFRIYSSPSGVLGSYTLLASYGASPYVDTGLGYSVTRYYRVSAFDAVSGLESEQSVSESGTTPAQYPGAPTNVVASGLSSSIIHLSWSAPTDGAPAESYKVYVATVFGGAFSVLDTSTATSYDHTGLSAGQTRYYKISAVDAELEEGPKSVLAQASTDAPLEPATPINLTADALSQTTIRVTWSPGVGGSEIASYRVYWSPSGAAGSYAFLQGVTTTSYNDDSLQAATKRYYVVSAVDVDNVESGQSLAKSATTDAADPPSDTIDYYVSAGGNDSATGTSQTNALKTIQAAVNKADGSVGKRTIAVMNGTYPLTTALVTKFAGTAAAPIIVEALAGHAPVVTGGPTTTQVQYSHPYNYWGEGIELRGTNFQSASNTNQQNINIWTASKPERSVTWDASNCRFSFISRGPKLDYAYVNSAVSRVWIKGADCHMSGAINRGDGKDAGNGLHIANQGVQHILVEQTRLSTTGHNGIMCFAGPILVRECLLTNSWEAQWATGAGNRLFTMRDNGLGAVLEDNVLHSSLVTVENPQSHAMFKMDDGNMLSRGNFALYQRATGGAQISILCPPTIDDGGGDGATDQRYNNWTLNDATGNAVGATDNGGPGGFQQPFHFKNMIFAGNTGTYVIYLQYRGSKTGIRGDWRQLFFFHKCGFQANYTIRIRDIDNVNPTITKTVTQLVADEPANFAPDTGNGAEACFVANPNFVSTSLPASTVPLTALSQARANFLPTNNAYLGTGVHLTRVNKAGGYSGATTIILDDAKWFRDPKGWTHLTGDTIYIEGAGARTITAIVGNSVTVSAAVTCSDNARVYRGSSATPNVGAA